VATSRAASVAVGEKIFILGGSTGSGTVSSVFAYDPAQNVWETKPSLSEPRFAAGEAVNGGVVYLAGGGNPADTSTILAYDTTTGVSMTVGALTQARFRSSAVFLNNRLYVAGGSNAAGVLDTIEEFDPNTGISTVRATLPAPRESVASVAYNGKIYFFGGMDSFGGPTGNCWEFDPVSGIVVPKTPLPFPSAGKAVAGDNGKMYLLGGITSSGFPPTAWSGDVLEYDPVADSWRSVGPLLTSRAIPMVATVQNTIYAIGGSLGGPPFTNNLDVNESASLIQVPVSGGWATRAPMPIGLSRASSGVVNNRLHIIGGVTGYDPATGAQLISPEIQIYDPLNDFWFQQPSQCPPRFGSGAATVDFTIYLAGGFDPFFTMQTGVFAYNTLSGTCSQVGDLSTPRARFSMAAYNSRLYSAGGSGTSAWMLNSIEEFDPATGSSNVKQTLPEPRALAGAVNVGPRIYIMGGNTPSGLTASALVYDPFTNVLSPISPMKVAAEVDEAVVVNGKIYVVSSMVPQGEANLVQEYDPVTDTWRIVEYVPTWRDVATIAAINETLYVIGGDRTQGGRLNEAWQIGPTSPVSDTVSPVTIATINGTAGANGWYTSVVQVALSASDNPGGTGVVRTEYAFSSIYGTYWNQYFGPVDITTDGNTTLLYRSRDKAMNLETDQMLTFNIDRTAPTTGASLSGSQGLNGWYITAVTITLSASDGTSGIARTEYSYNGSDWYVYSYPITLGTGTSGTFRLYYRSVDVAGNVEGAHSLLLTIDRSAPSISATPAGTAGTNGWYVSPVTVSLSAVDSGSGVVLTEYSLDNGAGWNTYSAPFTLVTEGTKTVLYRATNNAGLVTTTKSLTVKIDTTAPQFLPFVDRVSVASAGAEGNGASYKLFLNQDGRYVAFWSAASNLVPDDTNGVVDVFVHDRSTGTTERVSVSATGEQAVYPLNSPHFTDSYLSSISADGRYVLFNANAHNLAPPLGTLGMKVYLRDRQAGTTEMVSVSETGQADNSDSQGGSISADGRYVAFSSSALNIMPGLTVFQPRVFVKDRQTGVIENISVATDGTDATGNNMLSNGATISADGRYVLFLSSAANLVPDDTNGSQDLFIRDRQLNQTKRVNISTAGEQSVGSTIPAFSMSADGRYIAFESTAKNQVTGYTLNNYTNTYLHDRETGSTVLVNVSSAGAVNRGWQHSLKSISPDGRYVAYSTDMADIITENPYLFYPVIIHDMQTGANKVLCSDGCSSVSLAERGDSAGFVSTGTDLVQGDTNGFGDVFVSDRNPVRLKGTMGGNGWYVSDVQLTLASSADAGSGVARQEYSLDGSTWTTYTVPTGITAEGNLNLQVRSVDNAGLIGAIASTNVRVDRTPPATTVVLTGTSGADGWYGSTVQVTLVAQDAASGVAATEYTLNGSDWIAYTAPFTLSAEGTSAFSFRSRDNAGNCEAANQKSVKIDLRAPVTSASVAGTKGSNDWFTSAVTVTLAVAETGSGTGLTEYKIGQNGVWITYTGSFSLTANGITPLFFRSRDNAGLVEGEKSLSVAIDNALPLVSNTVACTSLNSFGWCSSNVVMSMIDSDADSGIAMREYRVGAGSWVPYTGPVTVTAEGVTYIAFRATDNAGLTSTLSTQVGVDMTPPVTTAALTANGGKNGWYTSPVAVSLSAADTTSGISIIEYRIGIAGAWTRYSSPFTVSAEGNTTLSFHSQDGAGNIESEKSVTVAIDTTLPATTVSLVGTAGTNGWYTSAVKVALTAGDTGSGIGATYYRVDGGVQQLSTGTITIAVTGSHTVEYWSEDKAGNMETHKSVAVNIDLVAPIVTVSDPANKGVSVPITKIISLTFGENIVAGTAYGSITLKKGKTSVALTKTISGGKLSIKPNSSLSKNSIYVLTVPAGAVKDLAGRTNAAYTLTFTTQR
jgi:N-acetylneuraminic acid mutarotase